jgi:hypothetical protein
MDEGMKTVTDFLKKYQYPIMGGGLLLLGLVLVRNRRKGTVRPFRQAQGPQAHRPRKNPSLRGGDALLRIVRG